MDTYARIKEGIISCTLRPGDIVNESDLAGKYGVGRTVVREALQALRHEGLVESVARVGYIVSPVTVKNVVDLFGVRAIVETAATALAAENATPEDIERIRALSQTDLKLEDRGSFVALNRRNSEFHRAIAEASHNRLLASMELYIMERLERLLNLQPDIIDIAERMTEQHRALATAIGSQDARKAREIALHQIETSRQRVLEAVFQGDLSADLSIALPSEGDSSEAATLRS